MARGWDLGGWALGDLLTTLFERRRAGDVTASGKPLPTLCRALLSGQGEVSGMKRAAEVLMRYRTATPEEKVAFFRFLADEMDLDPAAVSAAAQAYADSPDAKHMAALLEAAEPPRQELLRRLNQAPDGTADLVAMRVDLMAAAKDAPDLARVDLDFRHLFASWFNRGFLVLRRIGWESPANILEKIIAYEAVHEIHSWDDLRRRLEPPDRRCFAFFHPAMPDDPLIFVEVALTRGIPGAIGPLLAEDRRPLGPGEVDTAVFYSISNCQAGLRGISFGNSLIKQVVDVLGREVAGLKTFVTLSPIPGLSRWIETQDDAARDMLAADPATLDAEALRRLAARYLLEAKAKDGAPLDPVARFHLGNGAEVHEIHAAADLSPKGRQQSCGAMVNYLYDPARVEQNHEAFATHQTIAATRGVKALAAAVKDRKDKGRKDP
ncbi:malonyl-CoA decarboxylase [Seohaeicola sp. SP36]|jgi:malonyl-CoA decarboxylase|uniref:malonyl-CoA decarboxylase n=1 Tax=unclassified Seohaeicola TaxID=2641111 RepID=UPI00237B0121|nr:MULTISPECIES: malonyl-CoA decarboxylase [unclassified Seohaeicola]MDD9707661.1 malonyl-CoA decarboxylase [Seohaeicola sp. 4SK31]MDD9735902.1 malonyl-CoA decarboxylase [Seohaeicola sp. SP36]